MRHDFDDGKYTVIFDETSGRMSALRYGDEWRDLCGDKLIYSMLSAYDSTSLEVAQLQARVAELEAAARYVRDNFKASEDAGYHTRDREFAISILTEALR